MKAFKWALGIYGATKKIPGAISYESIPDKQFLDIEFIKQDETFFVWNPKEDEDRKNLTTFRNYGIDIRLFSLQDDYSRKNRMTAGVWLTEGPQTREVKVAIPKSLTLSRYIAFASQGQLMRPLEEGI